MARLHSRKRGKSGSRRPPGKIAPSWVDYPAHEIEELVVKLAKTGMPITTIGLELRDVHGIPSVKNMCGKSISQIVTANGIKLNYPDDLISLIKRATRVRKHMKLNKADGSNRTKLIHIESKIKRLVKYYTQTGRLPPTWKYNPETAALIVK